MRRQELRFRAYCFVAFTCLVAIVPASVAHATIPYTAVPTHSIYTGKTIARPISVFGKEYSHDRDATTVGAVGSPPPADPERIIAWDGIGGTTDGQDFTGTRPGYTPDDEVDALANSHDALFKQTISDTSHLVFSVATSYIGYSFGVPFVGTLPSGGPVFLTGGTLGGAGEISVEQAGAFAPPSTWGLWASQTQINGMPLPDDVDGLEIWGPEPGITADTDKYSLWHDTRSFGSPLAGDAVSVWNGNGTPYIPLSLVRNAVIGLLGPIPTNVPGAEVNLDALMVNDDIGSPSEFQRDPTGGTGGDRILFSINQIADPLDPSGYYATGSELFVMDASGTAVFLFHGGHLWDKAYALANFRIPIPNDNSVVDLDALEAIGAPEPASALLMLIGLVSLSGIARRLRFS